MMVETEKATLVIVITLVVVILFNLGIYSMVKRRREDTNFQIKLFSKAYHRARKPWEEEDAKLEELSKIVSTLKDAQIPEETKEE